jgi:hypothetical protein
MLYDPENIPSSSELSLLIDRKDGTLLLVSGSGLDTIWLYNITPSMEVRVWKHQHNLFTGRVLNSS